MANKTNCIKNGIPYYRIVGDYGINAKGKRIRKEFYGKNKKEAQGKKKEYEDSLKSGLVNNFDKLCLGEQIRIWLFTIVRVSKGVRVTSFERYEGLYRNYVVDSPLYPLSLNKCETIKFQQYYNKLYEEGKTTDQIKSANKLLKKFFYFCVDEGYILKNPLKSKNLNIPGEEELVAGKDAEEKIDIFTDEEIDKIISVLDGHRLRLLILLALSTGLRMGELLALTWQDVHDGKVNVNKSLKHAAVIDAEGNREYKFLLLPPKSKSSVRVVPYPTALEREFIRHKALQAAEKLKAGPLYTQLDGDYIFTTPLGTFTDPHNLRKTYARLLKTAVVDYRKFHSLRKRFATQLFMAGVSLKTVQILMGHSSISITEKIYICVMPKQKIEAVEIFNDIIKCSS